MAKNGKKNGEEKKKAPTEKKVGVGLERLPVKLTDAELLDFGQRLARCQQTLADHLSHAEAVKKDLKTKEAAIEADRSHLSGVIRDKAELRDVEVERWHDYAAGEYFERRTDTGEITYRRRLESHERQTALPLKGTDGNSGDVPDVRVVVDGKSYSVEEARTALDIIKGRKTMADAQEIAAAHAPGRTAPTDEPPRAA